MESILTLVKKALGIEEDYEHFDTDIIMFINTSFMNLNQLGVGPRECFSINDKTSTWTDFLADRTDLNGVKSFVYLYVRLAFDPPQNSFLVDALKTQLQELSWRLNAQAEFNETTQEASS